MHKRCMLPPEKCTGYFFGPNLTNQRPLNGVGRWVQEGENVKMLVLISDLLSHQ